MQCRYIEVLVMGQSATHASMVRIILQAPCRAKGDQPVLLIKTWDSIRLSQVLEDSRKPDINITLVIYMQQARGLCGWFYPTWATWRMSVPGQILHLEKQLDVIGGRMWGMKKRNFYFLKWSLEQWRIVGLKSTECKN